MPGNLSSAVVPVRSVYIGPARRELCVIWWWYLTKETTPQIASSFAMPFSPLRLSACLGCTILPSTYDCVAVQDPPLSPSHPHYTAASADCACLVRYFTRVHFTFICDLVYYRIYLSLAPSFVWRTKRNETNQRTDKQQIPGISHFDSYSPLLIDIHNRYASSSPDRIFRYCVCRTRTDRIPCRDLSLFLSLCPPSDDILLLHFLRARRIKRGEFSSAPVPLVPPRNNITTK